MNNTQIQKIGGFLLSYVFPVIYALTVMPFTVQFFSKFVSPPEANSFLLNLGFLPLQQVHTFVLPFFMLALELISIRLATGLWKVGQLDWKLLPIAFVLVLFQLFPFFSAYYDARRSEYLQLQETQGLDPDESRRADDEYRIALDDWNRKQGDRQQQIDFLQTSITQNQNRIVGLRSQLTDPRTPADERQRAQQTIDQLSTQVTQDQNTLIGLRRDQQQAQPPQKRVVAKKAPLPYSDVEFMTNSQVKPPVSGLFTVNSGLSGLVSLIFPVIVFGAGFVLANAKAGEAQMAQFPQLSLVHELEECSKLPEEWQKNYVPIIESAITSSISGLREAKNLTVTGSQLVLQLELETQVVKAFDSVIEQVTNSKIHPDMKGELLEFVNQYLKKQPPMPVTS